VGRRRSTQSPGLPGVFSPPPLLRIVFPRAVPLLCPRYRSSYPARAAAPIISVAEGTPRRPDNRNRLQTFRAVLLFLSSSSSPFPLSVSAGSSLLSRASRFSTGGDKQYERPTQQTRRRNHCPAGGEEGVSPRCPRSRRGPLYDWRTRPDDDDEDEEDGGGTTSRRRRDFAAIRLPCSSPCSSVFSSYSPTSPFRTARAVPRTQMRARKSTNKMDRTCAGELSPATSASLFLPFPFTALRVVPPPPLHRSSSGDVYGHSHASVAVPFPFTLLPSFFFLSLPLHLDLRSPQCDRKISRETREGILLSGDFPADRRLEIKSRAQRISSRSINSLDLPAKRREPNASALRAMRSA